MKITREMNQIAGAVHVLKNTAFGAKFAEQAKRVDDELRKQKKRLQNDINRQSENVKYMLEQKFTMILDGIHELNKTRKDRFKIINGLLEEALKQAGRLDVDYKSYITFYFDTIRNAVEEIHRNLKSNTLAMSNLAAFAHEEFDAIRKGVQKNGTTETNEESIENKWEALQAHIRKLVDGIYVESEQASNLGNIEKKVKDYAKTFEGESFKAKVEQWLEDVFKSGEPVYSSIDAYAHTNVTKSYFRSNGQLKATQNVIKHIRDTINERLQLVITGVTKVQNTEGSDIHKRVANIKKCLRSFVDQINTHMNATEFRKSEVVKKVVALIEKDSTIVNTAKQDQHDKSLLTSAIYRIAPQLVEKASKATTELVWLSVDDSKATVNANCAIAKEIDEAISKVKDIGKQFVEGGTKDKFGKALDDALMTVKRQIEMLGRTLDKHTGSIKTTVNTIETEVSKKLEMLNNGNAESDSIKQMGDKAAGKIEELYKVLFDKLNGIFVAVDRTNETFDITMKAFRTSVENAYRESTDAMQTLRVDLTESAEQAFNKVSDEMQILFADNHRAHLNALGALVNEPISVINKIINDDLNTGVKGLLKLMLKDDGDMLLKLKNHTDLVTSEKLPNLSWRFKDYVDAIAMYVEYQAKTPHMPKEDTQQSVHVKNIKDKFDDLLQHLCLHDKKRNCVFDDKFSKLCNHLSSSLDPQALPDAGRPVLKALRDGMLGFVEELEKGYVSRYDGGESIKQWVSKGEKEVLTPEGKNGAKVFLTILGILLNDLMSLSETCKQAQFKPIHSAYNKYNSIIADFFSSHGYKVPKLRDSHESELSNKQECTGTDIYRKINDKKFSIF
ncbi:hypothetical protein, conserved, partial [Babesia bigemina]